MSRYRWLRPIRAVESMTSLPALDGLDCDQCDKLLWEAMQRGDIRAMLNDVIVPAAHIEAYLLLYRAACPDQPPYTLPPNLGVNYDDLCAVFDRPNRDDRKRGRPRQEHQGWTDDHKLAFEMHKMLASPDPNRPKNPTQAARLLVDAGRVAGAGTPESLVKRLVREFRKRYSS